MTSDEPDYGVGMTGCQVLGRLISWTCIPLSERDGMFMRREKPEASRAVRE